MGSGGPKSVIVIGAGIVGASAAYFLGRAGYAVRILDAVAPAAGATGSADGAVSVASKRPGPMMEAALAGVALYRSLAQEGLFRDLFKTRPTLMVAEDDSEVPVLERHAEALAGCGVTVGRLDGAAMRARIPVAGPGVRVAIEVSGEGHAIGFQIVRRLIEAAGGAVERNRAVTALAFAPGGAAVEGVVTDAGILHADHVVLAAGGGSAALLGLSQALRPRKGQLLVTDRAPALNAALPGSLMSCRYLMSKTPAQPAGPAPRRGGLVIDPLRTGQFLIGGTREDTAEKDNDIDAVRGILAGAVLMMPGLAGLRLVRAFAGVRTATADGLPLIGRAPGLRNVVVATGFEGDGICLGPLAGKLVGQLVAGRAAEIELAPFDPARFSRRSLVA